MDAFISGLLLAGLPWALVVHGLQWLFGCLPSDQCERCRKLRVYDRIQGDDPRLQIQELPAR